MASVIASPGGGICISYRTKWYTRLYRTFAIPLSIFARECKRLQDAGDLLDRQFRAFFFRIECFALLKKVILNRLLDRLEGVRIEASVSTYVLRTICYRCARSGQNLRWRRKRDSLV